MIVSQFVRLLRCLPRFSLICFSLLFSSSSAALFAASPAEHSPSNALLPLLFSEPSHGIDKERLDSVKKAAFDIVAVHEKCEASGKFFTFDLFSQSKEDIAFLKKKSGEGSLSAADVTSIEARVKQSARIAVFNSSLRTVGVAAITTLFVWGIVKASGEMIYKRARAHHDALEKLQVALNVQRSPKNILPASSVISPEQAARDEAESLHAREATIQFLTKEYLKHYHALAYYKLFAQQFNKIFTLKNAFIALGAAIVMPFIASRWYVAGDDAALNGEEFLWQKSGSLFSRERVYLRGHGKRSVASGAMLLSLISFYTAHLSESHQKNLLLQSSLYNAQTYGKVRQALFESVKRSQKEQSIAALTGVGAIFIGSTAFILSLCDRDQFRGSAPLSFFGVFCTLAALIAADTPVAQVSH